MPAQRSVPATSGLPRPRRRSRLIPGLALLAGALALTLTACGGGGSTPPASNAAGGQATQPGNAPKAPPGVFGTAAAVAATSLEVQSQSSQVTVNFNSATTFTNTVAATLADVTANACVSVIGTGQSSAGQPVTARTVNVSQPGPNGCANPGRGGFGGGGAGRGQGGGTRTPRPSGSNTPRNFGGAFGTVTAVSGTGFTVHGMARNGGTATDTTVTVTSSTTYTKTVSATSSALAVGQCIAAIGPADDTGAVTAKSITISAAGPNGCSTGFRRGGGAGGSGAGSGSGSGSENGSGSGTGGANG